MTNAVITAACRTPIGKFRKGLSRFTATQLGSVAVREAVRRSGLDAAAIEEVIMGNVLTAGLGQNPARQAALGAGLPDTVAAVTVNKVCGSSLKAVMFAAQAIRLGDHDVVVAGGQESMSNAPYLVPGARNGLVMNDAKLIDSMVHDGLWDIYTDQHMGNTGEIVARRFEVSRGDCDRFAMRSHQKAETATKEGFFREEIVPVEYTERRGQDKTTPDKHKEDVVRIEADEGIRHMVHMQELSRLRPVFDPAGLVTAGNASQLSDGASAVVVESQEHAERRGAPVLARIVAYATAGVKPEHVMEAPIPATRRVLELAGMRVDDIDLFEHNEAFASASCAVAKELDIPEERFNIHGGAVALGHPIGASGTRVLTTLIHALKRTDRHRGLATLCLGGGNAVAMIIERPEA
jgi:acetyl-CoA C-acetyltransferase